MIKIFSPTDRDFTTNGDAVVIASRAIVHKVDNGDYYLEYEIPIEYSDYIKANNIIVAPTPQGEQAFRVESAFEVTRTKIRGKAYHVYYDSENYVIADSYVVNKNCKDALAHLNAATDITSPFTTDSDVTKIDSFRCVRKSLREAVLTVLERWGGHIVRDNFSIEIRNQIGQDNGVTIQYRKNLKEIVVSEDWSNVCTKLLPVGQDGYLLQELYLYAPTQYDIPYTKALNFDQSHIERDDYPDEESYKAALRADLIAQGTAYLEISQYPSINYTISANVEKITDVGDIVQVYDERLGVNILAAVLSFEYDCILGQYTSVQFGSIAPSLSDLLPSVTSEVNASLNQYTQDITAYLQGAVEVAVSEIWEALGASYVIYNGDELVIVDRLPAESAINVIRVNKVGVSISHNGVLGDFETFLSIDGELDFNTVNVKNLSLNSLSGGNLLVGGYANKNGTIRIRNNQYTEIGTIDRDGITLDGVNVLDNLVYKAGDTYESTSFNLTGIVSDSSASLSFSIPLGKTVADSVGSLDINELKLNVYLPSGGFLFGSYIAGGFNVLSDSNITVTYSLGSDYITIKLTRSVSWSVTDNIPVAVTIESASIDMLT